ncbi:hypothetical protein [Microvirga makkahensis]|uniref:Uncharacterized protein n=1 Tax=Microvirga makkahensis TaxID=1128670 RepID=A0A7X3MR65_9HYPH|nr:hypothetical protein [Microvirga makkahensis]MXQ11500.1 hypothetical protein [Microvirga makkahensis]
MGKSFARLSCITGLAVALCGAPVAHAAKAQSQASFGPAGGVQVQFDAGSRRTLVAGRAGSGQCFSFTLPQEWRSTTGSLETRLKSASSDAELVVSLRPSHELHGLPQPDLASRDAALLQRDYENLLGRPAQSVSLASLAPGAVRWSATWVDGHLPGGPMTVEAFILPLSDDWVLELSLSNIEAKEEYDGLIRGLLTDLSLREGASCIGRVSF